ATTHLLEGTLNPTANDPVVLTVQAKCFPATATTSSSATCDYESTAWATLALKEIGTPVQSQADVKDFLPYIVSAADNNIKHFPDAFIYSITNYPDYAALLAERITESSSVHIPGSTNSVDYNTAF